MSESVSAAIAIEGDTLRFAEVEQIDEGGRLLAVDQRVLVDDAADALLAPETDKRRLGPIVEGLQSLLEGTEVGSLQLAVHPSDAYSFLTPISADTPVQKRKQKLLRQASLVTGARSADELRLRSTTVRTVQDRDGEAYTWVHVLAVPAAVEKRMTAISEVLPTDGHEWTVSVEAAARVTARTERTNVSAQQALQPYTLAVGRYASHTEYALSRNREWYHGLHAAEGHSASNRAYYAAGLLNRIDVSPEAVGRLVVYGDEEDLSGPFRTLFECEAEPLNPFSIVQGADSVSEPGLFVPCLGAALDALVG
jgi:hypothetical protein